MTDTKAPPAQPHLLHAPGQWVVVDRAFEEDRYYIVPRAAFESDAVRFKYWNGNEQIASLHADTKHGTLANATLLAAAPVLADALKAILRWLECDRTPTAENIADAHAALRAAGWNTEDAPKAHT